MLLRRRRPLPRRALPRAFPRLGPARRRRLLLRPQSRLRPEPRQAARAELAAAAGAIARQPAAQFFWGRGRLDRLSCQLHGVQTVGGFSIRRRAAGCVAQQHGSHASQGLSTRN